MGSQTQVIVGRQVNHFPAVESADGGLLVLQHSEAEVRALGFEIVQLLREVGKRINACGDGHFSSNFESGNQNNGVESNHSSLIPECRVFGHDLKKGSSLLLVLNS